MSLRPGILSSELYAQGGVGLACLYLAYDASVPTVLRVAAIFVAGWCANRFGDQRTALKKSPR